MWLPTPMYRRMPLLLLAVGVLLISSGIYLGVEFSLPWLYFGVGCISALWGAFLLLLRSGRRTDPAQRTTQQLDDEHG